MDGEFKKIIIRKPDLDTCLTALVMGVDDDSSVKIAPNGAEDAELRNREILCIESGGSGMIQWNNLDHHHPQIYYPCACVQAQEVTRKISPKLHHLIKYVSMIDEGRPINPPVPFPSLSSVFSGMILLTPDRKTAFTKGIRLLKLVLSKSLDPFQPMPSFEEWQSYIKAKKRNRLYLEKDLAGVLCLRGKKGTSIAYLKSRSVGGSAELYRQGFNVVVMHNPVLVDYPGIKYTIASQIVQVTGLLGRLNSLEQGWGGRSNIIGSPAGGSTLAPEKILGLVVEYF